MQQHEGLTVLLCPAYALRLQRLPSCSLDVGSSILTNLRLGRRSKHALTSECSPFSVYATDIQTSCLPAHIQAAPARSTRCMRDRRVVVSPSGRLCRISTVHARMLWLRLLASFMSVVATDRCASPRASTDITSSTARSAELPSGGATAHLTS